MKTTKTLFLTDAQLKEEIEKCEYCAEKPCREACPADCSPADFIMAARTGEKSDYKRAAALILENNPLGGICGAVCPDRHCMKACVRQGFDAPVNIPAVQATIIRKAREFGVMPEFFKPRPNGKKVAVIGGGPAGYSASAVLAQKGYTVDIYETGKKSGGMVNLIPDSRLDNDTLKADLDFVKALGDINVMQGKKIEKPSELLGKGYDAVIVSTGLDIPISPGIKGEETAVYWMDYLKHRSKYPVKGKRVAVIGGGAVAADCAEAAIAAKAAHVEMFALEKLGEMPLTAKELGGLLRTGAHVTGRTSVTSILIRGGKTKGLRTVKVALPKGKKFHPRHVRPVKNTQSIRNDINFVIIAIGNRPAFKIENKKGVFYSGDIENGPTTVVEAVAAGKNSAVKADAFIKGLEKPVIRKKTKSAEILSGRKMIPVPLETDFFGRKILSPFLLSAAPPTDGYEQMKKAYKAGWAGGVMKTAFDNVPIHIPGEYMVAFNQSTYGNCDNVSGHPLERVCQEIKRLVSEFPGRLTMASTGGPVTGNDESDKKGWQSNTKKLESAGVMGIEYSLSCPQGGDGTKGDIVSQDPELTAKIVDWVLEAGNAEIPKLFKLTAAVTSIYPIVSAIKEVFAKYPDKKAGITLANTFPTLSFRKGSPPSENIEKRQSCAESQGSPPSENIEKRHRFADCAESQGAKKTWEEGVVVGMSGEGVIPISNLTLANVARHEIAVSGNGGPMDYKAAADFLALGVKTVQFCTIAMKYGCGIVDELHSGLSHMMAERGIKSVKELIGRALPNPITGFMELSPEKKISDVNDKICLHCGNCTRCSYMAITLNDDKVPETDASKCIGCSICVQKCFSGALYMRERTEKEKEMLKEL